MGGGTPPPEDLYQLLAYCVSLGLPSGLLIYAGEQYEKLRETGESKEKAARIANTGRSTAGKRGGKSPGYEE